MFATNLATNLLFFLPDNLEALMSKSFPVYIAVELTDSTSWVFKNYKMLIFWLRLSTNITKLLPTVLKTALNK